jgi:hypothetical protein
MCSFSKKRAVEKSFVYVVDGVNGFFFLRKVLVVFLLVCMYHQDVRVAGSVDLVIYALGVLLSCTL